MSELYREYRTLGKTPPLDWIKSLNSILEKHQQDWPVYPLELAIEEVLTNLAKYGTAKMGKVGVEVILRDLEDGIQLEVRDQGPPFDPLQKAGEVDIQADLDERSPGGLGLMLVHRLAAESHYRHEGDCNILTLNFSMEGKKQ